MDIQWKTIIENYVIFTVNKTTIKRFVEDFQRSDAAEDQQAEKYSRGGS